MAILHKKKSKSKFKTTFVTVNQNLIYQIYYIKLNSKTTFVTVNQEINELLEEETKNSKTTFVTVNPITHRQAFVTIRIIQKQLLLLLISVPLGYAP